MNRDKFNYDVPDVVWKAVVPENYQNRVVCLSCFDDFAYGKGIDIRGVLDTPFYFVGDKVVYEFKLVRSNH